MSCVCAFYLLIYLYISVSKSGKQTTLQFKPVKKEKKKKNTWSSDDDEEESEGEGSDVSGDAGDVAPRVRPGRKANGNLTRAR